MGNALRNLGGAVMGTEIERKFLVVGEAWRGQAEGVLYRQGYVPTRDLRTVRIRTAGDRAYLTLKGPVQGLTRSEFEYPIPQEDAEIMLATLCELPLIEKRRYRIQVGTHLWEVDEFLGENAGLILAEVELSSEAEAVGLPPWAGQEVSGDPRYYNSNLAQHPYASWGA
jgi:adenylate cyclase